jgi:hypothetical protein
MGLLYLFLTTYSHSLEKLVTAVTRAGNSQTASTNHQWVGFIMAAEKLSDNKSAGY